MDFNPRSPDGERQEPYRYVTGTTQISIHAPRMGSDLSDDLQPLVVDEFQSTLPGWGATSTPQTQHAEQQKISIHAPRMGSDQHPIKFRDMHVGFQSTLPGWGATLRLIGMSRVSSNFNPRSPDGERRAILPSIVVVSKFQSTLPGWGATVAIPCWMYYGTEFQSTLPGWGATACHAARLLPGLFQSTLPGWGAT